MYRHFVVVTVLVTLVIALFADGENRDAIGNELEAQRQQTELREAESQKLGPKKLAKNDLPRRGTGWGDDTVSNPTGSEGGGSEISVIRENGDVERVRGYDYGSIGPGPMLDRAGGTMSRIGPLGPNTRRKPSSQERARLERAGFEKAAGNAAPPPS